MHQTNHFRTRIHPLHSPPPSPPRASPGFEARISTRQFKMYPPSCAVTYWKKEKVRKEERRREGTGGVGAGGRGGEAKMREGTSEGESEGEIGREGIGFGAGAGGVRAR